MEERVENTSIVKKKGRGLLILLIISIIIIICLVAYIFYNKEVLANRKVDKKQCSEYIEEALNEATLKDETNKEEEEKTVTTNKPKCYGTYYGERSWTQNGISTNEKFTYTLKEDGTFEADFSGVSGTKGVFTINENTISLTGTKEVTGPRDKDTVYITSDLLIADDCSYIMYEFAENERPELKLVKR